MGLCARPAVNTRKLAGARHLPDYDKRAFASLRIIRAIGFNRFFHDDKFWVRRPIGPENHFSRRVSTESAKIAVTCVTCL